MPSPNTKDIRLKVTIEEDSAGAKRASKNLDEAAKSADHLDDRMKKTGRTVKDFDAEITRLEKERAKLIKNTDDLSEESFVKERQRLSRRISLYQRMKSELAKAEKDLQILPGTGGLFGGVKDVSKIGTGGIGGGGEGLGALKGAGMPALIAAVVPLAATYAIALGAALEGAIAGGAVAIGIAGGIASAVKDPRVKTAAQQAFANIKNEFFGSESSKAFAEPVVAGIHSIAGAFKDADFGGIAAPAAGAVHTLADGIGGFIKALTPGFEKTIEMSSAATQVFSDALVDTGKSLSDFMTDIRSSKGTLEGLDLLFHLIESTIRGTGEALAFLGDAYHGMLGFTSKALDFGKTFSWLVPVIGWTGLLNSEMENSSKVATETAARGERYNLVLNATSTAIVAATYATKHGGSATGDFSGYMKEATDRADDYAKSIWGVQDALLAQTDAQIGWEKSIDDFTQSVHDNGKTTDISTEKGRNNVSALDAMVASAMRVRDANEKAGMSAHDANKQYEDQIKFIETLAEKLGIAKDKVLALVGKYEVTIIPYIASPRGPGARYARVGAGTADLLGLPHRASGGPVPRGMFWAGENGPELIDGSQVYTHQQSMAMTSGSARPIVINASGFMGEAFNELVREIQRRGGTLAAIGIR